MARAGTLVRLRGHHWTAERLRHGAHFTEWGKFAPGITPGIADVAAHITFVAAGHIVMRMVAGPARIDRLARQAVIVNCESR